MATITQHAPGTFCWPELATSDQAGARTFYTRLFDWGVNESDMGDGSTYTMLQNKERNVGALYQMHKEQKAQGIPPHWLSYVAVADADAAVKKATQLGGKPMMEPFDVFDFGRMAVIQDPHGAMFAVWQAKQHAGAGVMDEAGSLCWTELMTKDTAAARTFYTGLFGWTTEEMPMGPMQYTVFKRGDKSAAGMIGITPGMGPVPPNWLPYFAVQDTDATVAKAILHGGKVLVAPQDVPNVGRFAILHDPQGASFAILGEGKKG